LPEARLSFSASSLSSIERGIPADDPNLGSRCADGNRNAAFARYRAQTTVIAA
jgi:hypothetical protein